MEELYGSDFLSNLFTGFVAGSIGTAYEVGKGVVHYSSSPSNRQRINENASQFKNNFGKYTPSSRDNPFTDSNKGYRQNTVNQSTNLQATKQIRDPTNGRWNERYETGFEDERDNNIDDRVRRQEASARYNSKEGENDMSSDTTQKKSTGFTNFSSRPSDYGRGEKLISDYEDYNQRSQTDRYKANIQNQTQQQKNAADNAVNRENNKLQSGDRRYATNKNAETQQQKNQYDYAATLYNYSKQSGDRRYSTEVTDKTDRTVRLDSNAKSLEGSKFKTTTESETDKYKWNNVNKTAVAEAQVKAGTYGIDQAELSKRAHDKANHDRWVSENKELRDQADHQNAVIKLNNDMGRSQKAYDDQRIDRQNDAAAATGRFNAELAQRNADRAYKAQQDKESRDWTKQEFSSRSSQFDREFSSKQQQWSEEFALRKQNSDRDFALRERTLANQTNQINSNIGLDNNKYTASRADVVYNRNYQSRSFAF